MFKSRFCSSLVTSAASCRCRASRYASKSCSANIFIPSLSCSFHGHFGIAPNASGEPRPMAGATQERKLLGVGSTAMLGGRALELRVKKTQQGPAEIDDEQCLLLAEKLLVG